MYLSKTKPTTTAAKRCTTADCTAEQNKIHLQQQLIQTQQYAVLDKGLSAHLHQLGQFIQNYQAIEEQLGKPTLARQKLSEAKSELEQLTVSLGTVEQIELKRTTT